MQYFFVKSDVQLTQAHKQKALKAVSSAHIDSRQIPLDRIYCGFIAWEHIHAQQQIGSDMACLIAAEAISPSLLPYRLRSFDEAGDLVGQLVSIRTAKGENAPLKLALINGTGTMLGDTVVGASVFAHVANDLRSKGVNVEIDIYCAWNARPGVEGIWERTPGVGRVFGSSLTVAELRQYDAYWDYLHLLRLEGYGSQHFGDFYFNHFGINPAQVDRQQKLPDIRVSPHEFKKTQDELIRLTGGARLIFIQPEASTKARSMPETFFVRLIKRLSRIDGCKLVMSGALPKALSNFERKQIINLQEFTSNNLDRYLSVIAQSDYVISVDTLALHVAMGCNKPGMGMFSLSEPSIRLKYSPKIEGVLIPDGQSLAYWEKHKSDDQWETHRPAYENAWNQLSPEATVQHMLDSF